MENLQTRFIIISFFFHQTLPETENAELNWVFQILQEVGHLLAKGKTPKNLQESWRSIMDQLWKTDQNGNDF